MLPSLPQTGSLHNQAFIEDILILLVTVGFDVHLNYAAIVDIDALAADIEALINPPKQQHRVSWWNRLNNRGR
jgi:hypothetical protein